MFYITRTSDHWGTTAGEAVTIRGYESEGFTLLARSIETGEERRVPDTFVAETYSVSQAVIDGTAYTVVRNPFDAAHVAAGVFGLLSEEVGYRVTPGEFDYTSTDVPLTPESVAMFLLCETPAVTVAA